MFWKFEEKYLEDQEILREFSSETNKTPCNRVLLDFLIYSNMKYKDVHRM